MKYFKFVKHKNIIVKYSLWNIFQDQFKFVIIKTYFQVYFVPLMLIILITKATYNITIYNLFLSLANLFATYFKSPIYSSILSIPTLIFKYSCLLNFFCYRTSGVCNWGIYLYTPVYLPPTELTGSRCTHAHHRITESYLLSSFCGYINGNIIGFTSYLRVTAVF